MDAGERRVGADFSPDWGEFCQTNSGINFISGSRPAAAQLDDREPDRSHVNAGDEAAPLALLRRRPARGAKRRDSVR